MDSKTFCPFHKFFETFPMHRSQNFLPLRQIHQSVPLSKTFLRPPAGRKIPRHPLLPRLLRRSDFLASPGEGAEPLGHLGVLQLSLHRVMRAHRVQEHGIGFHPETSREPPTHPPHILPPGARVLAAPHPFLWRGDAPRDAFVSNSSAEPETLTPLWVVLLAIVVGDVAGSPAEWASRKTTHCACPMTPQSLPEIDHAQGRGCSPAGSRFPFLCNGESPHHLSSGNESA